MSTAYKPNNPNGRPAVLAEPVQVTLQLEAETLRKIDVMAKDWHVSKSEVIRRLLAPMLAEYKL